MLIKPRASVSSGVNGRTRGLSAADAQEALEKTALVSVFPRAGRCPVLTEFVIPLGRHGECVWVKEGMQESSCVRVMVRSPGDHARWARGRGLLRAGRSGGLNARVCLQGFPLNSVLAFDARICGEPQKADLNG